MYKIPARTLFFGKNLIFMPECRSTNDEMLLLCQKDSPPEGTVIITAMQTAGRGQRGNEWHAEPGKNLTFTLLVRPLFLAVHQQFYLNIFVSLGIRDYLTNAEGLKVQIKWPNDILVKHKKICGMLTDNQISGSTLANSAIGVGLNVNQQQFEVNGATSVLLENEKESDLDETLGEVLAYVEARYLQLKAGKFDLLLSDYLKSLYLLGTSSQFADRTGTFSGTIRGIDPSGRLLISRGNKQCTYDLKEIRYLNDMNA